jgi:hypothetical protein
MEAVCTSETSVYSNETTQSYISEDSHLHTYMNIYEHTTQCHIYKTSFSVLYMLKIEEHKHKCPDHFQNMKLLVV